MKNELKPCPNCGNDFIWTNQHVSRNGMLIPMYYFECHKCHYCSESKLFLFRAKREWNRRVEKERMK